MYSQPGHALSIRDYYGVAQLRDLVFETKRLASQGVARCMLVELHTIGCQNEEGVEVADGRGALLRRHDILPANIRMWTIAAFDLLDLAGSRRGGAVMRVPVAIHPSEIGEERRQELEPFPCAVRDGSQSVIATEMVEDHVEGFGLAFRQRAQTPPELDGNGNGISQKRLRRHRFAFDCRDELPIVSPAWSRINQAFAAGIFVSRGACGASPICQMSACRTRLSRPAPCSG